ncbi:MAG: ABC transporter permease [Chloroflexales bacterium]|nr:ABC transporter permease [Chloroflexales bacterium]
MLSLIQADLLKTGKRPMGWMLLALSVLLVSATLLTIRFLIPEELPPEALNPYNALVMGPQFVQQSIGGLLIIVFGASLAGNEYGYDTWKNLLIRRPRRTPFIVSKWLTLVFSIGLGLIVLAAVSLAMSFGVGLLTDGGAGMSWGAALLTLLMQLVSLTVVGALALMGTVIGRSTVAGIIVGFVWFIFDGVMAQLPWVSASVKGLLFSVSEANLLTYISGQEAAYPPAQSVLVIAVYLVAPLIAAALVFRQRDIAG